MGRFFQEQDDFGTPLSLSYKGAETFQTRGGGFISILIKVLTVIMIFVQTKSMLGMEDPTITRLALPLSEQEKLDLGELYFADHDFFLGVTSIINSKFQEIPPEVGKLTARSAKIQLDEMKRNHDADYLQMKDCQEYVTQRQLENSTGNVREILGTG